MDYSGESDVYSEKDEQSIASDSYEEIELEDLESLADKSVYKTADSDKSVDEGPYSEEPLASDQWLQEYHQERRIIEEREEELQK